MQTNPLLAPVMFAAKVRKNLAPVVQPVIQDAMRSQTSATSHNTFRPDIYRTSEGYIS